MMFWALGACTQPTTLDGTAPTPTDTHTGTTSETAGAETHTGSTLSHSGTAETHTGTPSHTGTPGVDCEALPTGRLPARELRGGLSPSEDFAFDDAGHLISSDGARFLLQDYPPGAITPFATSSTDPSSMRMLPDGDLVVANIDTQTLYRIRLSDGATSVVVGGFGYATGIDVHPDGHVFIGDGGLVKRIDPSTGQTRVVVDLADHGLRGIINGLSFDVARDALYLGVGRDLMRFDLDASWHVVGQPSLVYTFGGIGELLGLGVDACDNVYALFGGAVVRFRGGAGAPEVLFAGGAFTTNLQWGSGLGGWGDDQLYVVDRGGDPPFVEIDVGVPSKPYW
ncbi:MAG: hypothetical protein H6735_26975 [Alphaproteobacteria bacterium]|nr:hypothetical protein [Alphaproteobacteria bacterium]